MKKRSTFLAGLSVVAMLGYCGSLRADETGVAGIHTWVRIGHRICLQDHYHDGSGTGATRSQAQRAAIRAWVDFTAWEYGTTWGSYAMAVRKSMSCSGGPGQVSCSTQAIPCRGR
jgi:hypothetical protein